VLSNEHEQTDKDIRLLNGSNVPVTQSISTSSCNGNIAHTSHDQNMINARSDDNVTICKLNSLPSPLHPDSNKAWQSVQELRHLPNGHKTVEVSHLTINAKRSLPTSVFLQKRDKINDDRSGKFPDIPGGRVPGNPSLLRYNNLVKTRAETNGELSNSPPGPASVTRSAGHSGPVGHTGPDGLKGPAGLTGPTDLIRPIVSKSIVHLRHTAATTAEYSNNISRVPLSSQTALLKSRHVPKVIYSRSKERLNISSDIRPVIPPPPASSSQYSSPVSARRIQRQPTKETRRLSITENDGWMQLNQYKLKDEIGKVGQRTRQGRTMD